MERDPYRLSYLYTYIVFKIRTLHLQQNSFFFFKSSKKIFPGFTGLPRHSDACMYTQRKVCVDFSLRSVLQANRQLSAQVPCSLGPCSLFHQMSIAGSDLLTANRPAVGHCRNHSSQSQREPAGRISDRPCPLEEDGTDVRVHYG